MKMINKIISLNRVCMALTAMLMFVVIGAPVSAQVKKPSQALNQARKFQADLLESFDKDIASGKAQPFEWEMRTEKVRAFAGEQATPFKASDWKGDELLSLATLYQWAEKFDQAAEAYRAYYVANPKAHYIRGIDVRASLSRAYLETGKLAEAEKVLRETYDGKDVAPLTAVSRVVLHKDLAEAFRDDYQLEKAAEWALQGYEIAKEAEKNEGLRGAAKEGVARDKLSLAALHVAMKERLAMPRKAAELHESVRKLALVEQPALLSFYESELSVARLFGGVAPEIAAVEWMDGPPRRLSELRGKVVLLDFWAMWCSPCIAAFPHHRNFQTKFGDKGFEVIGVTKYYGRSDKEGDLSLDAETKSLRDYKNRYQLSYPIAVGKLDDVTNEERYSIISVPTIILIDRRGNVRHVKRGVGDYRKLERQIVRLIDEKP